MKTLSNTHIPFSLLTPIMDFISARFATATPAITLNRNTALPLFAGPMSGANGQLMAVITDEASNIRGVATAYADRSPVDGNRICYTPMFLAESPDIAPLLVAEVEAFAKASGSNLLRIDSHLTCPIAGMQVQTMTYVKDLK